MKQFISIKDVKDLPKLLALAKEQKKHPFSNKKYGENKTLGLIFFNSSLRTRLSSQKAAQNLGMNVITFDISKDGWSIEFEDGIVMNRGKQEHIKDAVLSISQYCNIIGIRSFASLMDRKYDYEEFILKKFIQYSTVPVISLESATLHPLQSFADILTIDEYKQCTKPKIVLSWTPHPKALPQAVANSFVQWVKNTEAELIITHPHGYELSKEFTQHTTICYKQNEAFENADFIYAKNWSSYREYGKVLPNNNEWTITSKKMALTNHAKFMHCLPIRRNVIATDEVIDSETSLIVKQANNRIYTCQAVLLKMLQNEK